MTSFSSGEHQKLNMVFGFFEKDAGLRSYLFLADSQITNGDSFQEYQEHGSFRMKISWRVTKPFLN